MQRQFLLAFLLALLIAPAAYAQSVGNPTPGSPHDTLNFHLKKAASGEVGCSGSGHAAFIRYEDATEDATARIYSTDIFIGMVDWEQIDNDEDGLYDEDPDNGIDDDADGFLDEDGTEPGASTGFSDCDGLDGEIALQIRDTEPARGVISTQEWFIRMSGMPEQNVAFWTNADQVTCLFEDPDTIPDSGDEVVDCNYEYSDWIQLGYVDLSQHEDKCVKQVKLKGKNTPSGGGKTPFCDITGEFEVDADIDGDGDTDLIEEQDQYLFSISCVDVPETTVDESLECPLSRMIWVVDEDNTTTRAKAQVFVGHTGTARVKGGTIKGPGRK
jgi:hypothetical protein